MADPECVRVAIRIRPLVPSEREKGCQSAVERTPNVPQVAINKTDAFTYNYVFDENNSQEDVYRDAVLGLLGKLFEGYNVTILAYGQTGSGKTHTMGTAFDGNLTSDVGVIPRAMNDIFQRIEVDSQAFEFTVTCSFMELYQEQLFDLLSTKPREQSIVEMREERNRIVMPDLTERLVCSSQEATECLMVGSSGRAVASTAMNEQSSRSHAIFTLTVKAAKKDDTKNVTTSKFHLVDLAGSERSKKTKATGDRFKEGVKINQGLLALGNVISALGSGSGCGYVGYRDSKLTRLLQDSLGGNSVTLMIACISPADYNIPETLSTLRYADRARKIKNKPIINQDPHVAEINRLNSIIQKLRMELLSAGRGMSASLSTTPQTAAEPLSASTTTLLPNGDNTELLMAHQQMQERCRNLQKQLRLTLHGVAEKEMRVHISEDLQDKLKTKADEMKAIVSAISLDISADNIILTDKVEAMRKLVESIDEELEKTQCEIAEQKRCASIMHDSESDEDDSRTQLEEQANVYTNKQISLQDELRRINRELDLKEELHQRVAVNLTKFYTIKNDVEEKSEEYAMKIKELEMEKSELLEKLKHVKENASAKLAEERRKRLQVLEQEINEMKRKNLQQSKLLKLREKETQKINNLYSEIQAMKQSKVKLIRAMRMEADNFRQWKQTRERELMQLKSKDRKMQTEMARKEALHTKQRNVLKRKCEEAQAVNKRLKDALDRQKAAQLQRQKNHSAKDNTTSSNIKIEQVSAWVERELELIGSLIDAEYSLEQLLEDRAIVSNRIAELKQAQPQANTAEAADLAQLEEELEMRNAQIADLQQKVCVIDLDTRMNAICEGIQSFAESRAVVKHLFTAIVEMRREYASRALEQKVQCEAAEEGCKSAVKRMRLMELEHEEALAERETTYEDKIAVLLRELHNTPQLTATDVLTPEQQERMKIQEEQLNKMDAMRDELETNRQYITELTKELQALRQHKQRKRNKHDKVENLVGYEVLEVLSSSSDDFIGESDAENDPDWRLTPRFEKKRKLRRNSSSDISSTMDDPSTVSTETSTASRKKLAGHCKCRGGCSTKRCGCFSNNEKCGSSCQCSVKCSNGKYDNKDITNADDGDGDDSEAAAQVAISVKTSDSPTSPRKLTFANSDQPTFITPKVARQSYLSFETASAKKKFFD